MVKPIALIFFEMPNKSLLDFIIYTQGTNYIERKFIKEFVEFGSKTLIHKIQIPENEFVITITDNAFTIYITILDEIGCGLLLRDARTGKLPHIISKKLIHDYLTKDIVPTFDDINQYFKGTDQILDQLDETKKVLKKTLSALLERGEKIEDLVEKTEHLSTSSKIFFQRAKKFNNCWGWCWW
jgi:synaptobrevin family protein YKT6